MFLLIYSFSVFKCNNTWIAALSLANMQIMHKLSTPDRRANVFFPNCDSKTHRRSLSTHISFVCFVCIYKKRTIVTNALLYIYICRPYVTNMESLQQKYMSVHILLYTSLCKKTPPGPRERAIALLCI